MGISSTTSKETNSSLSRINQFQLVIHIIDMHRILLAGGRGYMKYAQLSAFCNFFFLFLFRLSEPVGEEGK